MASGSGHPAYTSSVPIDRLERSGLNRAWIEATASLPLGWHLDGLTCASTGLAPEQRSGSWRAWAVGPKGEKIQAEEDGPIGALHALARELLLLRGSKSG
jgi:hypothetical protein